MNAQWSYGDERRALHVAVMNNSSEMVRLLMRAGADATAGIHPHRDATTARTMAIERGLQDLVRVIDEEGRRRRPAADDATRRRRHPTRGPSTKRVGIEADRAGPSRAAIRRG